MLQPQPSSPPASAGPFAGGAAAAEPEAAPAASPRRVGVVFNPHSKKNRARPERFAALQRLVGDRGEVRRTSSVDEVEAVARDFVRDGIDVFVADGGDGAFHWLLNAAEVAARDAGRPRPLLMPTRSGTIDFLAVKAGLRGSAEDLLAALIGDLRAGVRPRVVHLDSLRLRGERPDGSAFARLGFACAAAGVGQRFFERFYAHDDPSARGVITVVSKIMASASLGAPPLRAIPGRWLPAGWFGAGDDPRALGAAVFAPQPLDVSIDGEPLPFERYRAVNVGAIDLDLAGVFRLFPHAAEPGVLQALVGDPSVAEVLALLPAMAAGRPLRAANLVDRRMRTMQVAARGDATIDPVIDGELFHGLATLSIDLGPQIGIAVPGVGAAA